MIKLTKIIATIGPSSDSPEMIEKLILAGVDVFRFNFKHSSVDWHKERIVRVNQVAKKLGRTIGTLLDLQGPELRINMPNAEMEINKNEMVLVSQKTFTEGKKGFSISHPQILSSLQKGQKVIADDGAFTFEVEKNTGEDVWLISFSKGILKNRKSFRLPGADLPFSSLIDRDFEGLKLAERNLVDFIALSYVRNGHDLKVLRDEMIKYRLKAKVIAKIETKQAIDNLDEIIRLSDGIMVARGDLGIELPIEEVPYYQKVIIKKCLERGIPVITATQMLQSMIESPFPTRAEVSDVANATYDLTDAVMLSGESASGHYPLQAVEMMARTVIANEKRFIYDSRKKLDFQVEGNEDLICEAAYNLYLSLQKKVAGFIVFTQTGRTPIILSRYRPTAPIFAVTCDKKVADSLSLSFAVFPIAYCQVDKKKINIEDVDQVVHQIGKKANEKKLFIGLFGDNWVRGGTTTLRLIKAG